MSNIMSEYLAYVENTEPPVIFHRWSLLTAIGALLERNAYYGQGYFTYYPNLYVMLLGESGTRKSTAINLAKQALKQSGYNSFSAEKTSKEKYLQDLADQHEELGDDITMATLFGNDSGIHDSRVTPNFIVAGEFNDFIGNGNIEFMSILGNLWDWPMGDTYENRIKTGKSIKIPTPTLSLLGGNTATGLSLSFPPNAIGQGFFSRLILVHSAASDRRIRNPILPATDIASLLREIRTKVKGKLQTTPTAERLLDVIYERFVPITDTRFNSYSTRRNTQLMKLIIIVAAIHLATVITEDHIILANTILCHAEQLMPTALGEFGRARNADVAHNIVQFINRRKTMSTPADIWEAFSQDLENGTQMHDILFKLQSGNKIVSSTVVIGGHKVVGFLGVNNSISTNDSTSEFVDFSLLTKEEREMKK